SGVMNLGVAKGTHAACGAAPCGPYSVLLATPDTVGSGGTGVLPTINTTTQGKTLTSGSTTAAWSGEELDCSQFAGADMSVKIQACFVALNTINAQGGIANAMNFTGAQTWSVDPFDASSLPRGGKLLLPAIVISVNQPVKIPSFWAIEG